VRWAQGRGAAAVAADPRSLARAWLWLTVALTLGALLGAVLLAPAAGSPPGRALVWLLFTGSSAHVASTAWFYTLPEIRGYARRHRTRYLWIPVALMTGAGAISSMLAPPVMQWCLLPYFGWQFFHFQKQNLSLAALAASALRAASPRPAERGALMIAGLAGIAGLLSRPWLLQLTVRPAAGLLHPAAAIAFAAAAAGGLAALARRPPPQRPAGFCVTYAVSLSFWLPVFVFSSPYAAVAGMTIAHGLQYLVLTGLVAAGGEHAAGRPASLVMLASAALAGGAILAGASHLHSSGPVLRCIFGVYLGAVMSHFVIDAGLWRLRDEFPRAFLASRVPYLVRTGGTRPGITATDRSPDDIP